MKILHVIPAIARRYGGPSSAIRELCRHLADQSDIAVEVAATDADGAHGRLRPEDADLGVPVHLFRRTFSERWKYSRDLAVWLRENVRRFDVVHIHALWSHASTAAAAIAHRAEVPYIIRPAGMLSEYSLTHRSWSKTAYWWAGERATVQRAAAFHATSDLERDDIVRACPAARVFVIPNGVEDAAWSRPPVERPTSPDHVPTVLFLSRLHPKKGLTDLLLPAFARMQTATRLVIAGGPDEHAPAFADHVRSEVTRLQLDDRVTMIGPVSPADRWQWFDSSDLFILPSHSENFGIVVAEAMARSRPVIITDGVQLCDHIRAANAGLVTGRRVDEIAAALDTLCANSQQRAEMGQAGYEYCRRHFSWSSIAGDVRRMYEQFVGLKNAKHFSPNTSPTVRPGVE